MLICSYGGASCSTVYLRYLSLPPLPLPRLLLSLGLRSSSRSLYYVRQPRQEGSVGWDVSKK